jgi:hypothetical protein
MIRTMEEGSVEVGTIGLEGLVGMPFVRALAAVEKSSIVREGFWSLDGNTKRFRNRVAPSLIGFRLM